MSKVCELLDTEVSGGGVGVCGLLGVLFVGLKLGGVINWSWWWVTCPIWIGPAIGLAILVIVLVGLLIAGAVGLIAMGVAALMVWFNSKKGG